MEEEQKNVMLYHKKIRDKAKAKFVQKLTKLEARLEDESSSVENLEKALNQVNETWNALDDAQTDFIVEIGDKEQTQENRDFSKIDNQREDIVTDTEEKLLTIKTGNTPRKNDGEDASSSDRDDREETETEESHEKAEFNTSERNTSKRNTSKKSTSKKSTSKKNTSEAHTQKKNYKKGDTSHHRGRGRRISTESNDPEEIFGRKETGHTPRKNDKEDISSNDSDEHAETGKEGTDEENEFNTSERDTSKENTSKSHTPKKNDKKGKHKKGEHRGRGRRISTDSDDHEETGKEGSVKKLGVDDKIRNLLSSIRVSKKKEKEFETKLQDRLVNTWNEDTECNMFRGVQVKDWETFLKLFQETTGIEDKVMAAFKTVPFTEGVDKSVKNFKCEGLDMDGRYGMVAIVKYEDDTVDVAYAVFKFKADLVGSVSQEKYNLWNMVKDEITGLYRKAGPIVEDVMTGKKMKADQRLKVDDVVSLSQNFIIAKAMSAFAHAAIIDRVLYEDEDDDEGDMGNGKRMLK